MQPRCAIRFESHTPESLATRKFFTSDAKTPLLRRIQSTPDPDTFEKYRDTPPISIAIFGQKYALLLADSSIYTINLYHDTASICITIQLPFVSRYFAGVLGPGVVGTLPICSLLLITGKWQKSSCDMGLRCEISACILRSSGVKCLRFGHSLRFGLRCECPRCEIASDAVRAMQATKGYT